MRLQESACIFALVLLGCSPADRDAGTVEATGADSESAHLEETYPDVPRVVAWLETYYQAHPVEGYRVTVEAQGPKAVVIADGDKLKPQDFQRVTFEKICPHLDEEVWAMPNAVIGVHYTWQIKDRFYDCGKNVNKLSMVTILKRGNLRSGPDTAYPIIGKSETGQTVRYTRREKEWLRLYRKESTWIHRTLVETEGDREQQAREANRRRSAHLVLLDFRLSQDHGFARAEGTVKNLTNHSLKNVQAIIVWRTQNGDFVKKADALIDYNPILPGQTSPFTVLTSGNPQISQGSISFSTLFGSELTYYREE